MAVPVIEKYVNMRHLAHTKRHRRDLAEWTNKSGGTEAGYWANFNASRKHSEDWFEGEKAKIENDPNMNYRDRATEIVQLADRRMYPAWSGVGFGQDCGRPKPECQHRECAFLRTYVGDAEDSKAAFADNQAFVNAELLKLRGPDWDTTRNGQPTKVPMTEWELTLLSALTNPQDGSVPVPTVALATITATAGAPATLATTSLAEVISEDDPRYAAVQDVFERTCRHCGEVRKSPRGKVSHERVCDDNPNRAPLNPTKEKEPAEAAPAAAEVPVDDIHEPVEGTHEPVPGSEKLVEVT